MSIQDEIVKIDTEIKDKLKMSQLLAAELKEIELKQVLLRAELEGLEYRRRLLADVASSTDESAPGRTGGSSTPVDVTRLSLVDAVVHVINEAEGPLRIDEVRGRLEQLDRHDDPSSVSPTLAYAETNRRISRVARGLYGRI